MIYLEDLEIGSRRELGSHTFTAEEIVRFARAFDPQPFHLSEEGAAATHFGRLCASGWHTASVWMKLVVASQERELAETGRRVQAGPSPGFTDLKWIRPVFAGDTISYSSTLLEKKPLRTRPGWGMATNLNEGVNQDGELVFSFVGKVLIATRPQTDDAATGASEPA